MPSKNYCAINVQDAATERDKLRQTATNVLNNVHDPISMKLAVFHETRRPNKSGIYPVRIRFYYNKQAHYVNTGVEVKPENFVANKIIGIPRATVMNNIISEKLAYTQRMLEELRKNELLDTVFKSGTEIKNFIESGLSIDELLQTPPEQSDLHFETLVNTYASRFQSQSSVQQYTLMLKKVATFCDLSVCSLTDINVAWLKDFDQHCTDTGMNVNGRAFYMRAIRAVYNDAIDRELISIDKYPFRRFKIKKADTAHRNIPLQDFRHLMNYDCNDNPHYARYRDIFMLSFYLCGMNLKDLLFLKKSDLRGDYIYTKRQKTDVNISLRIEPEAREIFDRYRGKDYLLNIMDTYGNHDDFRRKLNRHIKLIVPYATIYWARHSWATFAGQLNIPDPIIDIAQSHKLQGMNAVYVERNMSKAWGANRRVIDYIKGKKKQAP